jgi:hypothetical protein
MVNRSVATTPVFSGAAATAQAHHCGICATSCRDRAISKISSCSSNATSIEARILQQVRFSMKMIAHIAGAALLAATAASSAQAAGEARVEVRGGVAWAGNSEAVLGVAAGYDFDLGDTVFGGIEGTADKILVGGVPVVWGLGGRLGAKVSDATRLHLSAGVGFSSGDSAAYAGAGIQQKLGGNFYGKVEYRRYFGEIEINTAAVGVGLTF